MTDGEKTILEAITEIVRFKALTNRVPGHALLREVKARTKDVKGLHAEDIVGSLARQGYVRTGATLNDRWCDLSHPLNHTDTMNEFEKVIKDHLDKVAQEDPQFAEKYKAALAGTDDKGAKKKDIKACCNYIIAEVKKTGRQGFTDDEVYGMAIHFYDETSIKAPDKAPSAKVVVNREVKLSADEVKKIQEAARKEAEEKVRREEIARIERERKAAEERARKAEEKRKAEEARKKEEAKRKAQEEGSLFLFSDFE